MQNIGQCIDTVGAQVAVTVTALETENHAPLTRLASNAASMEKPQQCSYISALKNQYNQNIKSSLG